MPEKKKPAKRRATRRGKKATAPHVYREPHTAAELGLDCALCGAPAIWFDFGRGQHDHRAGFVCDKEPPIDHRERLLVKGEA